MYKKNGFDFFSNNGESKLNFVQLFFTYFLNFEFKLNNCSLSVRFKRNVLAHI